MKKCPFCGEEIQNEAIKCRYCKEFLNNFQKEPGTFEEKKQDDKAPISSDSVCPKCGHKRIEGDKECPSCGVIYAKVKKNSNTPSKPSEKGKLILKKVAENPDEADEGAMHEGLITIPCPHCKEPMDIDAYTCPHCGKDGGIGYKYLWPCMIGGIILGVIINTVIMYYFSSSESSDLFTMFMCGNCLCNPFMWVGMIGGLIVGVIVSLVLEKGEKDKIRKQKS